MVDKTSQTPSSLEEGFLRVEGKGWLVRVIYKMLNLRMEKESRARCCFPLLFIISTSQLPIILFSRKIFLFFVFYILQTPETQSRKVWRQKGFLWPLLLRGILRITVVENLWTLGIAALQSFVSCFGGVCRYPLSPRNIGKPLRGKF